MRGLCVLIGAPVCSYMTGSHKGGVVEHVCTDPQHPFNLDADPAAVKELVRNVSCNT